MHNTNLVTSINLPAQRRGAWRRYVQLKRTVEQGCESEVVMHHLARRMMELIAEIDEIEAEMIDNGETPEVLEEKSL